MIVTLKFGCTKLRDNDTSVTVLEIALFKMIISSIFIFPFTFIFEMDGWTAFGTSQSSTKGIIFAGVTLTFLFQTSNVGLTAFSLATTVGKIFFQNEIAKIEKKKKGIIAQCKM